VMLTTPGLTFAASVATSGVPARTGGEAKGALVVVVMAAGAALPAACATCC